MTGAELYWLLKLDDFQNMVGFLSVMCGIGVGFAWFGAIEFDSFAGKFWASVLSVFEVCLVCAATFLPSTKQAAMIIVAPKIINSEFVSDTLPADAKELYGLAKAWLRDHVETKTEKGE